MRSDCQRIPNWWEFEGRGDTILKLVDGKVHSRRSLSQSATAAVCAGAGGARVGDADRHGSGGRNIRSRDGCGKLASTHVACGLRRTVPIYGCRGRKVGAVDGQHKRWATGIGIVGS